MLKKSHILIFCSLICSACAPFGFSESDLEQRVEQQDMQLRQMQPQQADAWNQIQAMRQEINQLKGQLDDLNNAGGARALADRVRQHDQALRQVDNNMALNLELGQPMGATPPASAAIAPAVPDQSGATAGIQMTGTAPDSSAYSASQTGSYGLPPDNPQPATQPAASNQWVQVTGPSEETWGKADPRPQVQAPAKDISLALFDSGVNSYNARNYAAAEKSFKDFLKNYPNHTQTAEAQFYLAECDFQRNQFPQAAVAYDAVITKYPKSSSAPSAYLKQAICFSKMNQKDAAKLRMQEIIKKFPNSPEAARAKSFLKTNK